MVAFKFEVVFIIQVIFILEVVLLFEVHIQGHLTTKKKRLVPLKVAKASRELHIETIPVTFGLGWSNSDNKAISVQL